jgi:two-component system cell cycle sensor histidine kinase/response regulator CckA
VELEVRVAPDAGAVRIGATELQQVLMNLAVNARDAMPNGGHLLIEVAGATLTAADRARRPYVVPGEYARLRVRDTGCGMDQHTLARVFEPFFSTKAPGSGTGLGLATVYEIVKRRGGYIWAESAPGTGTTFEVFLPRGDVRPSQRISGELR